MSHHGYHVTIGGTVTPLNANHTIPEYVIAHISTRHYWSAATLLSQQSGVAVDITCTPTQCARLLLHGVSRYEQKKKLL